VRLTAHCANRLIHEDKQIAVLAACAAGGQVSGGYYFLLQNEFAITK
jgi:hypothetical protein